jgi:type I restriction enzyme S subunit
MKLVELSDIGRTVTGKTPSSNNPEDFGDRYCFVTPTDSLQLKFIDKTERSLSELGADRLKGKLLPPKSVMVSCIGSAMGKVVMNRRPCVTNQQFNSIVVDQAHYSPDYIYYALKNNYRMLRNAATGSTALPLLNKTDFDRLKLRVHADKNEQVKVSSILSALDAKIELNNRINAELEGMAKLLYDYWFVQFDFPMTAAQAAALGKPHLTGHPYRASGGKMIYNETLKRDIPEGWAVKPLFDAMAVQYGFPFSTKKFTTEITDVPVIRIRDILENSISLYTTEQVDERYRLEPHDLVIGMDGNFHMNFWDKDGSYLNQRSVRIRARDDSSISTFQAYFELSPYIKAREKNVSRTTVGHLSDKDLKRLHLLQIKGSKEFDPRKTFDSLLSKIIHSRVENQELTQLRDWLLPMLMNGQVTVGPNER